MTLVIHYRLRKGKVKMALGCQEYYTISLCEEKCSIQLSFLHHKKSHSTDQCVELLKYFESKLHLLMKDFMQASAKPKAYIPCFYQDCSALHIELDLLCNGDYQHCPTVEKTVPGNYYCDLFINQGL